MSQCVLADLEMFNLIYLATPYSKYWAGPQAAFEDAAILTAALVLKGLKVYSPICHGHPLSVYGGIEAGRHDIWLPIDENMMDISDALLIGKLDGWEDSFGVNYEHDHFLNAGKPVFFVEPNALEIAEARDNPVYFNWSGLGEVPSRWLAA